MLSEEWRESGSKCSDGPEHTRPSGFGKPPGFYSMDDGKLATKSREGMVRDGNGEKG